MEFVKLGEIGLVGTGTTPTLKDKKNYESDDIHFFKPSDIGENCVQYLDNSEFYISNYARKKARIFPKGTVLCTCIGIIGKIGITKNEATCNQQINYIIPKDDFSSSYIAYALMSIKEKLNNDASKAIVPILNKSKFSSIEIPLVDKTTQQKIVDVLDNINSLIKTKEAQLALFDELVQSQFAKMFDGCNSFSSLEDLSSLITKGASPNWQGVSYVDDGVLFITSENVREGFIDYSKKKFLEKKINDLLPRSVLKYGDILINIVGASIGRAAMFDKTISANINQAVSLVRIDKNKINLKYLVIFLNSKSAINQYLLMKKGGARDNLSLKNIADLKIPLPPIDLQNKFASFVQQVDKTKLILNAQILQLKELLNSKMDEYFR